MIRKGKGGGGGGEKAAADSEPMTKATSDDDFSMRDSSVSTSSPSDFSDRSISRQGTSPDCSPYAMSPWNQTTSWSDSDPSTTNPFASSSSSSTSFAGATAFFPPGTGLVGSLVREEGHIYSLAASRGLLYTGSDSKNIHVWKDQKEFDGFKANSGLVKAIVISPSADQRIFTGHQDGKIRIWRVHPKNPRAHKRAGTLPRLKDFLKSSMNPSNYVDARRRNQRSAVWIRHTDAVSCLSLSPDASFLYSGSWDRTIKVWRLSDSRCLDSIPAHDDAVNSVVAATDNLVFSGSADGTVKVWRRESTQKGGARHLPVQTLLRQDCAVTALAVDDDAVYCGSSDGVLNFWDRGRQLAHGGVLQGHKMAVLCLAAAGSLLFTGSADKNICVWRRSGGGVFTCLSVMTGHDGPVKCLAVEADRAAASAAGGGRMWVVYSGSLDKSVKVWKVADPEDGGSGRPDQMQRGSDKSSYNGSGEAPRFDEY